MTKLRMGPGRGAAKRGKFPPPRPRTLGIFVLSTDFARHDI